MARQQAERVGALGKRAADLQNKQPPCQWLTTAEASKEKPLVQALVTFRAGWTAQSWAEHLQNRLARLSENEMKAAFERAAELLLANRPEPS